MWRNWFTRTTQNRMGLSRVGSSPTMPTMPRKKLPSKDFLWSSDLAYAVGLLVTDGCLSSDKRHIIMRSAEKEMLRTFKKCLGIENKIGETTKDSGFSKNKNYRVRLGNVRLYNWLLKIGLFPAKTYTIGKIKIPNRFLGDFVRGHFDGDGSVRFYQDNFNIYRGRKYANNRLFVRLISASKKHMEWLRDSIQKHAGIIGALYASTSKKPNRVPIWTLKFSKKESVKFFNWIYYHKNIPLLKRKRVTAEKALLVISMEKRRAYSFI